MTEASSGPGTGSIPIGGAAVTVTSLAIAPASRGRTRPVLVHLTTTDMSLDWLLLPQLRAFAEAGYDVVGMSAAGPHVEHLAEAGVRHIAVPAFTRSTNPLQDITAFIQLVRLLRRERPDVLHTHNPKPGILGRIAGRLARVPRIVNTQHGLYAQPSDRLRRRLPVYVAERVAAAFGHVELVQNPEDVHTLVRILRVPERKVRLLGNGIDLGRFDPARLDATDPDARTRLRADWGVGADEIVVGTVGRLVREKGIVELLEAAHRWGSLGSEVGPPAGDEVVSADAATPVGAAGGSVESAGDEVVPGDAATPSGRAGPGRPPSGRGRLVVVGPVDPDKADAVPAEVMERAIAEGVVFAGQRTDMPECYRAFDVFVTASWREGFPRSAMEAAAMGLPTVATDIRGNRQVVADGVTGVLVPVRDADGLAAGVARLAGDVRMRAEMAGAARDRAIAEFDQRRVIERSLEAYVG